MKWWSFSERTAKPHHHPSSSLCLWDLWKHTGWVVFTPALLLHLQSDERSRRRSCCSFCSHSVIFPSQLDQQVYTNWASVQLSLEDFAASQLFFFQSSCVSVLLTDVFCLFNCSEPLRTSKHHLRLQMFGCWRGFFFPIYDLWLVKASDWKNNSLCIVCDNPVIFTASRGGQRAEEETGAADDGEASGTRGHAAGKPESEMFFFIQLLTPSPSCIKLRGWVLRKRSHSLPPSSSSSGVTSVCWL